jgi:membrane-associated phospholipid phosphatase
MAETKKSVRPSFFNSIFWNKLLPHDFVFIVYILISSIFIFAGYNHMPQPLFHLAFRLAVLLFIFLLIVLYNKFPGWFMKFVRNFYVLPILAFWYTESYYFHGIFFNYIDPDIVRWEGTIFGLQPSLEFSKLLPRTVISEIMYSAYFSFYIIIFLVCLLVYLKNNTHYPVVVFSIIFSFCLMYIFFMIVPSMGPHYWFHIPDSEIPTGLLFGKAVKLAQLIGENPTGAFPSSHVAISILLLCLSFKYLRKLFYYLLPLVILLCASTVYIKSHYLLDVVSGIACVPLLYWMSHRIFRLLGKAKLETDN